MVQGPTDQTVKCEPRNRQPLGHALEHRVGASQGMEAAGLGKTEEICSQSQAGGRVPQWSPSSCGEGQK